MFWRKAAAEVCPYFSEASKQKHIITHLLPEPPSSIHHLCAAFPPGFQVTVATATGKKQEELETRTIDLVKKESSDAERVTGAV